jgi:dephospho-CoA kinase
MNGTNKPPGDGLMVLVVALTGGIASGKSTVSGIFRELGVPVVDTDEIARELVEPGQPLLSSVVAAFGQELLDAYGRLKRRKLRNLIFKNKDKRRQLEELLHPRIAEEARDRIARIRSGYCILVIPLLAEKKDFAGLDRVLVVDTDPALQLERLQTRDKSTSQQARNALAAQASREERLAIADDVIKNSGPIEELDSAVRKLHRKYQSMSAGGA